MKWKDEDLGQRFVSRRETIEFRVGRLDRAIPSWDALAPYQGSEEELQTESAFGAQKLLQG